MRRADREDRLQAIKVLGRIAHRRLKDADLVGVLTVEGEDKYLRLIEDGSLSINLLTPHRTSTLRTEFSEIEIRSDGRKVFCIRWDSTGYFKDVSYEPGDWEQALRDWPEPIPFD